MQMIQHTASSSPEFNDDDFRRFTEFFYHKTGMLFAPNKRYFVDKRVQERIVTSGRVTFREYFDYLKSDVREYQALVNTMTVNETYFYRESYHLDCLVKSMLPEVVAALPPRKPLRIWSMPCSTGEEPYSIAFYLLEYFPYVDDFEIEIVASDIDTAVIEKAQQGLYAARALQNLPSATVHKYTTDVGGGLRQIVPALRDSIKFKQANLMDVAEDRMFRGFHVVFCRNLLIYFDDVSRREAAAAIYTAMAPGGFVCLGHSESMSRISPLFSLRKFPEGIVYQKPV
jgi:chemotaxis protein methyltransferase CheR